MVQIVVCVTVVWFVVCLVSKLHPGLLFIIIWWLKKKAQIVENCPFQDKSQPFAVCVITLSGFALLQ